MTTVHVLTILAIVALPACKHDKAAAAPDAGAAPAAASPPAPPADNGEVPSLAGFEGEVDLVAKGTSSPAPIPFAMLVKNEAFRVDVPDDVLANAHEARMLTGGGKVFAIVKPADKKAFVVLDAKREAVLIDFDTIADQAKGFRPHGPAGNNAPPETPPKVAKTAKKEKVAGFTCEDWQITNADHSKLDVCAAEKAAGFFHFTIPGIPAEQAWALQFLDGQHTPLKGVAFDKAGSETGRVEVTKIDKRPLDAAQFEVPPGYKTVTIEQMMGSLGGGVPSDIPRDMPHGGHGHGHHHGRH